MINDKHREPKTRQTHDKTTKTEIYRHSEIHRKYMTNEWRMI